jgi:hypothetical protein
MPARETRRYALRKELSELARARRTGTELVVDADLGAHKRDDERTR